jgi:phage-related baseplate assembly protein
MRFAATTLDLSTLAAPSAVEDIDYEALLADAIGRFTAQWAIERAKNPLLPAFDTINLESDPARKVIEACVYREMLARQRINEAVRSCMVATAIKTDLDNLAAFYGVVRQDGENDETLRSRIVLAPEGFATAGPVGAYQFHARSADPVAIKDVMPLNPSPGKVKVVVQARAGNGIPPASLLNAVRSALSKEDVIPHTDMVDVVPVIVREYTIDAGLTLYPGPDAAAVLAAANSAVRDYAADVSRIGQDVTVSGLHRALQQPGVQRVTLRSPAAGLVIAEDEASYCSAVSVTMDGRDE